MLIVKYLYNFTCSSVEMLKGCMAREGLGTPAVDESEENRPMRICTGKQRLLPHNGEYLRACTHKFIHTHTRTHTNTAT